MKDTNFNPRHLLSSLFLLICSPLLWAAEDHGAHAGGHGASAITAQSHIDAGALYRENCAQCHGGRGDGSSRLAASMTPRPTNFTSYQVAAELTQGKIVKAIAEGKAGTAMEGWKHRLSAEQISALASYIRDEFMPAVTTDLSDRGRAIYAKNCSVCHGDRGQGAVWARSGLSPAPADFTDPVRVKDLTRDRMVFSVTYGRPQTAMAAWQRRFSDAEIEAVVDYVRDSFIPKPVLQGQALAAQAKGAETHAGHAAAGGHDHNAHGAEDLNAPLPNGLAGNLDVGGDLYQQNCVDCHGTSGDGKGPRAFFIFPKPRDFSHPAARAKYSREHLYFVIADGVIGSEMPAWKQVLSNQQMADLSEYVFQSFIQPEGSKH